MTSTVNMLSKKPRLDIITDEEKRDIIQAELCKIQQNIRDVLANKERRISEEKLAFSAVARENTEVKDLVFKSDIEIERHRQELADCYEFIKHKDEENKNVNKENIKKEEKLIQFKQIISMHTISRNKIVMEHKSEINSLQLQLLKGEGEKKELAEKVEEQLDLTEYSAGELSDVKSEIGSLQLQLEKSRGEKKELAEKVTANNEQLNLSKYNAEEVAGELSVVKSEMSSLQLQLEKSRGEKEELAEKVNANTKQLNLSKYRADEVARELSDEKEKVTNLVNSFSVASYVFFCTQNTLENNLILEEERNSEELKKLEEALEKVNIQITVKNKQMDKENRNLQDKNEQMNEKRRHLRSR